MSAPTPIDHLKAGSEILLRVLEPYGFSFNQGATGVGSGGGFASGTFVRGDRIIEVHFRYSLGLVSYRIGEAVIDHENYLRFAGYWSERRYPGFSSTPMDGFTALAHDLSAFFTDFMTGTGEQFKGVVAAYAANPNRYKGFSALGRK